MKKIVLLSVLALASSGMAANCKKGKPCGNTCIAVSSVCRIGAPSAPRPPITAPTRPAPMPTVTAPVQVVRVYTPMYGSCDAAQAAGHSDMLTSDPNYHPKLDRDNDGIACESGGDDSGATIPDWRPPPPPVIPVQAPVPAGLTVYRVVKADSRLLTLNSDYKDQQMFLAGIEAAPGREGVLNAWIKRTFPVGSMVLGEVETPGATVRSVYIWESGRMLNAVPVTEGFALTSAMAAPRYLSYLMSVQEAAKATGKGFWTK